MDSNSPICQLKPNSIKLKTDYIRRSCRYHWQQGQTYQKDDLLPENFCPHAYAKIYPHALSLLYSPHLKSEKILCPNQKFQVGFLLSSSYTFPTLLRQLKRIVLFLFHKFGVPTEIPDRKISIKVIHSDKRCPQKLKKGETFSLNIWRRKELCPASFYAMYPFYLKGSIPSFHCPDPDGVSYQTQKGDFNCRQILTEDKMKGETLCPLLLHSLFPYYLTLKSGGKFEWTLPGKNVRVQCPHRRGVVTELSLLKKNSQSFLQVKVVKVKGICYFGIKKGQTLLLSERDFKQK